MESSYDLLDLLFLGEEEWGWKGFFLEPAAIAARVWEMISSAYCAVSASNCL